MALTATVHHVVVALSDVDRSVYETLDLRIAQHPSETMRYLLTRMLAYCFSFEEGIAFGKGGVSSTDEPPVVIRDPTGALRAWVDVGVPSAERLHKASKAAQRVAVFTHAPLARLRDEARTRPIHKVESIDVWPIAPSFLEALEANMRRSTKLGIARNDGQIYVDVGGVTLETTLTRERLTSEG